MINYYVINYHVPHASAWHCINSVPVQHPFDFDLTLRSIFIGRVEDKNLGASIEFNREHYLKFKHRVVFDFCLQDVFYDRYLVRKDLFEPVVSAFLVNGSRYNLLNRCEVLSA